MRQRVLVALQNSRYTEEHKLPFRNYLQGQNGGILLAKMVSSSGKTRSEINALLNRVRPLEFYMPVPQHRENWEGGTDLLVASHLEDNTVPRAYNLRGEPVAVSADEPPSTPTLVLVPVETDFSRQLPSASFRNRNDRGGRTIGTYTMDCDPYARYCEGGGGGGGPAKPAGFYMTYSNLPDTGEPWTKGSPEIEVHIHGPNGGDSTYGADLACAGERQTEPARYFDQNNNTWSGEYFSSQSSRSKTTSPRTGPKGSI